MRHPLVIAMDDESAGMRPEITLSRVDLPEPFAPASAALVFSLIVKPMFLRISLSPKARDTSCT